MPSPGHKDRDSVRFAPRVAVAMLAAGALFVLLSLLYALPTLLETTPAGAIPDYRRERVVARMDGKVPWLLASSCAIATGLAMRGILPGSGRQP